MHRPASFRRSLRHGLLPAALALCAVAAAPLAAAQALPPVGVLYPIKTMLGQQGVHGAELAAEMINAGGGLLNGQPMKLVVYDDNYSPADAVAAARKLASEDKATVIVGATNTAVALGVLQVAKQNNQLFLAAVTKAPQITDYDRGFRFNPLVTADGEAFNKFLLEKIKPQRMAIVVENGDYGRSTVENMKAALGDKVVDTELYELVKQTDFSTVANRVKAANPDVVCIAYSLPEQGGALQRALVEAGVTAKRCLLPGNLSPQFVQVAGAAAEGVFTQDIWAPSLPNDTNRKFVAAFQAKYKEVPGKVDFLGFESIWVLGQAVRKAGTLTDTAKLAATLRDNAWDSPRGEIRFPNNQATAARIVTLSVKGGQIVVSD